MRRALATLDAVLTELITELQAGGLDHEDDTGLAELIDLFERQTNRWPGAEAELLATCRDRGTAERECQRSMTKVLERRCLLTPTEAKRRMHTADAVGPRISPTGVPLPRLREEIGAAMRAGTITARQITMVDETLNRLDRAQVHPDTVREVETELVGHRRRFAPKELKIICQRYLDALDPDGPEPDELRNQDQRAFRMHTTPSGAVVGEFRLTPETGAKAHAIFSSLASPRVNSAGGMATADLRRRDQRMHDAFDDLLSRLLRVGGLPDSGGTPATVIVTIDQTDLLNDVKDAICRPTERETSSAATQACPTCGESKRPAPEPSPMSEAGAESGLATDAAPRAPSSDHQPGVDPPPIPTSMPGRVRRSRPGRGITSHGIRLTVPELLNLAGEAEIYPVVLTQNGLLLDMGRNRRIANKHQTLALIARDGGCSFPGCDHPPEWCERHHVIPWLHNGATDLKNLTLLCSYHHRHFLNRGWQVRINPDGLPEWIPPRYIDPEQRPMINNRILAKINQSPLVT